jgi:hypothetical protein
MWSLLLTEQQEVSTKNFIAFVIKVAFLFWFWAHVSSDQVKMAKMHMGTRFCSGHTFPGMSWN